MVEPATAEEASAAVKFATSSGLPLAVRCGGHSTRGASSSDGLVIDLSLMRDIHVNAAEGTGYSGTDGYTLYVCDLFSTLSD